MQDIIIYICATFYFGIVLRVFNYIIKSLFFIKPMGEKYDILCSEVANGIKGRIIYIILSFLIIWHFFYLIYFGLETKIPFLIYLTVFLLFGIICLIKYKKYDIIQYISQYSTELYDWNKVYKLNIDENIKEYCFALHKINYKLFKIKQ